MPLLVEIPHAGLGIPECIGSRLNSDAALPWSDADLFVDKLFESCEAKGATRLVANLSRYVVDLNRCCTDRSDTPHGVIWRQNSRGVPLWNQPLKPSEREERIQSFYAPYHELLKKSLDALRHRFGYVILLAAHSMPSNAVPNLADVVIGSCSGTSASREIIRAASEHFRSAGLRVEHDFPYRGGWTTTHYGNPAHGTHAVQVELKRSLYMNEQSLKPDDGSFARLQNILMELVQKLGRLLL